MARDRSLDIAVTGLAARFPGCADINQWWGALKAGRVLTRRYGRQELLNVGVPTEIVDDPDYVPVRGHLDQGECFDNDFFGISDREAELMDPQHRLMLEVAWQARDDAASSASRPPQRTGVYASSSGSGYLRAIVSGGSLEPPLLDQVFHGTEPDFMASRISYKLDLTGPAIGVQTACSSSLVATHLAIQALLNGECDEAIVLGAGVGYPQAGHLYIPGGVLSHSGNCRPFDENADGVVPGSAVTCVVLRRLADAREGPEPYGVILGSAINNDGASKVGYYAPSADGQEAVIRSAFGISDIDARSLGYLETHGTGTRVGDPIEWSAASAALAGIGALPGQIAIGALKANIGHTDAASGLASLIKALLVVRDGTIPPVAGFTQQNPLLEPADAALYIPRGARSWITPAPRRAAISSFGIGGANAHLICEQYVPEPRKTSPSRIDSNGRLLVLSAADSDGLTRASARLGDHLTHEKPDLNDVAFTLAAGRSQLSERLAVAGRDCEDIVQRLANGTGVVRGCSASTGASPLVFAFPGQGVQQPGMAQPFVECLPGFSEALEQSLAAFPADIYNQLRSALLDTEYNQAALTATELAQPALFAMEHAAATALIALGARPVAVIGHSLGEITALCVAGSLDLASAARFVVVRGRAMQACPAGAMLALACGERVAMELVAEAGADLELATVNAPEESVLAGTPEAVRNFQDWLGDRVRARLLSSPRAFHSSLMEAALPPLREEAARADCHSPTIPFATNLGGRLIVPGDTVDPEMLVDQSRNTVRFADGLSRIAGRYDQTLVEVGPGHTLSTMAERMELAAVPLCPSRTADHEQILTALGQLWADGSTIDPVQFAINGDPIHLPGYSFSSRRLVAPEAGAGLYSTHESSSIHSSFNNADTFDPASAAPAAETGLPGSDPVDVVAWLSAVWTDLLGKSGLTEDADFLELGGDSLLVTHLGRRIRKDLGVRVPLQSLLTRRTLKQQADSIVESLTAGGQSSD